MDTISRSPSCVIGKRMATRENAAMDSKDQQNNMFYGTLIALFFVLLSVYGLSRSVGKKKRSLPPGPWPWPLFGNLFSLGAHPHQAMAQLAERYGSIMSLFFGSVRVVILSDASTAKELFSVSDAKFSPGCSSSGIND
jgi:hypothetical protein